MNKSIYVSILGLSLSTINDLKNIIHKKFCNRYQVNWTNISDSRLQILLINDDFSDSDYVKKLSKSNIQILKLKKHVNLSQVSIKDTLFLPLQSSDALYEWIEQACEKNIGRTHVQSNENPLFVEACDEKREIQHQELSTAFHKIYDEYEGVNHFLIQNNQNSIACFDLKNREFYRNSESNCIAYSNFDIIPADINAIVRFKQYFQAKELSNGIWQCVWDYGPHTLPEYRDAYRLKHWPQPELIESRSELLKISAYLSKGCTAEYIHQKTNIHLNTIYRYLYACDIAQMIEKISTTEALDATSSTTVEIQEVSKVRGFFSSLRKKLGL